MEVASVVALVVVASVAVLRGLATTAVRLVTCRACVPRAQRVAVVALAVALVVAAVPTLAHATTAARLGMCLACVPHVLKVVEMVPTLAHATTAARLVMCLVHALAVAAAVVTAVAFKEESKRKKKVRNDRYLISYEARDK